MRRLLLIFLFGTVTVALASIMCNFRKRSPAKQPSARTPGVQAEDFSEREIQMLMNELGSQL